MLFRSKWSSPVPRAGEHYCSFHSKFKDTTNTIHWSVHLSPDFLVLPCSLDTIRFLHGRIPICGNRSMASSWKHQSVHGSRWYLPILCGTDNILNPNLHFSGLVQYRELRKRVCYSVSNLRISHDGRVLYAGSLTILCFFRKRANPYVVRSWASSIRWVPSAGALCSKPLRAVQIAAKLSGRRVVLCVGIAFPNPSDDIYFLGS